MEQPKPESKPELKHEQKPFNHLVRIANTDLDGNKQIGTALMKVKGVGFMFANALCKLAHINNQEKVGYLAQNKVELLDDILKNPIKYECPNWLFNRRKDYETGDDKHLIKGDLDFQKGNDIKRLRMIRSYRGSRHAAGLPTRGQKTRSNFRKNKGKVTGVQRKKLAPGSEDAAKGKDKDKGKGKEKK